MTYMLGQTAALIAESGCIANPASVNTWAFSCAAVRSSQFASLMHGAKARKEKRAKKSVGTPQLALYQIATPTGTRSRSSHGALSISNPFDQD
jgi:hypothetical protein